MMNDKPVSAPSEANLKNGWIGDLAIIAIAVGVILFFNLGARPLAVPSEARYVEVGREMVQSGDWLNPRINGVLYLFKPPLFYWIQSAFMAGLGATEFAFRAATALLALIGCAITYAIGRKIYSRQVGLISAFILATSFIWFGLARVVLLDIPLAVFVSATLMSFLFAISSIGGSREQALWFYAMYAGAAAATLTKGLIGVALPSAIVLLWIVVTGSYRTLLVMKIIPGTLLFLGLTVPWHLAVGVETPEFWHFYFVREHFIRYTSTVHGRTEPWWFFIAVIAIGFLPWSVFAFQALRKCVGICFAKQAKNRENALLLIWVLFIVTFFSLSGSKLIPYVAPALPPLAVLIGAYVVSLSEKMGRRVVWALSPLVLLHLTLIGVAIALKLDLLPSHRALDDAARVVDGYFYPIVGLSVLTIAVLLISLKRGVLHVALALCICGAGFNHTVDWILSENQPRSAKPLAEKLKAVSTPADEVIIYRTFLHDVPVYLGRRVSVFGWTGELDFGRTWEDVTQWMFDEPDEFWRRWESDRRVYSIIPLRFVGEFKERADVRFVEIARTPRLVLAVNKPLQSS